jgi:uncharacterized protein
MQDANHIAGSGDRLTVLDVLRAFALLGIIITHSAGGYLAGRPPAPDFMTFTALDGVVAQLGQLLTFGKFFTIFSFLFGLSFAIQMRSAEQKGAGFTGRYTWRLLVLALIAMVHNAFYAGDILIIYALLGLLLIPFRRVNTKVLLVAAVVLILNVPGLLLGWMRLDAPPPALGPPQVGAQTQAPMVRSPQQQFDVKKSGSPAEIIVLNLTDGMEGKVAFQVRTGRAWITFGLFLLGLCAGRMRIFHDSEANRALFRRLAWSAGVVALGTTVVAVVRPAGFQMSSIGDLLASFSWSLQQASLSAFYVAVITLLLWRKPTRGMLPLLAPAGRMGLTVYLSQTVFGVLLFYGFGLGLLGELGVAAAVALGLLFFVIQVLCAHLWMERYSMGPVEWLWRSLTYLRRQPNGRATLHPA